MSLLSRLVNWFWFQNAPAARLAMLRILIGLFALGLTIEHLSSWAKVGQTESALFEPVGVIQLLNRPVHANVFQGLLAACLILNVVFILGWRYRITGPLFAGLFFCILSYRNSWTMIYHSANLTVLHVLVLAVTPAADALSLDAWRRRRGGTMNPADSWCYGWPIRLICTITVVTYVLSGVAKVAGPLGWGWATSEGLRSQIAADGLRKEVLGDVASSVFVSLYDQVWFFAILAPVSLGVELGAPLALLNRRIAWLWVLGAFMMHWGIFFLMGISFRYQLSAVAFASFFSLERPLTWFSLSRLSGKRNRVESDCEPVAAASSVHSLSDRKD